MRPALWIRSGAVETEAVGGLLRRPRPVEVVALHPAIKPPAPAWGDRVALDATGLPLVTACMEAHAATGAGADVSLVIDLDDINGLDTLPRRVPACVRLTPSAFDRVRSARAPVDALAAAPLHVEGADVMLAAGDLYGVVAVDRVALEGMITRIPNPERWRGLVIAATDPSGTESAQPRYLWRLLGELAPALERWHQIGVLDAGPIRPGIREFGYASGAEVQLFSLPARRARGRAFADLAQRVSEHRCFAGPAFSEGDAWFAACADRLVEPADAATWTWAIWSHHLAQLTTDLLTLTSRQGSLSRTESS